MVSATQEPVKKDEEAKKTDNKDVASKKDDKKEKESEMTEEDKKLQDDLNLLVERLSESDASLYEAALESMRTLIRTSTTSMTSVPKPLKFMLPHFDKMKEIHAKIANADVQRLCADIISVLAMTAGGEPPAKGDGAAATTTTDAAALTTEQEKTETDEKPSIDCLNYRLIGKQEPIGDWGHEYVRHLCIELVEKWRNLEEASASAAKPQTGELLKLAKEIVAHHMKHNAEVEACDLLIEIERLDFLKDFVEQPDCARVCLYLLSCAPLTPDPDNMLLIRTAMDIYLKFQLEMEALRCAILLNDIAAIKTIFFDCKDTSLQKQMAILLGRQQIFLDLDETMDNADVLQELNSNANLFHYFRSLARELDIMEPKTPEDIYKTHLEQTPRGFGGGTQPDSTRMNLAAAFVNGFVNMAFGGDKMITTSPEDANKWFYKNKEFGMFSAAATQGLIYRWDVDGGLTQCDRFLYVADDYIKAGSLLAVGILGSGIQDQCDPAAALLGDHVNSDRIPMRIGSILGLGLAYANSKRDTVWKEEDGGVVFELRKVFTDDKPTATPEVIGLAALSLGLICVGTAKDEIANDLLVHLMERSEQELKEPNLRMVALGIALIYLGTQNKCEVMVESTSALPQPFGGMVSTLVDVCAYAGTGNVLKIQKLLHVCSEHYEQAKVDKDKKKEDEKKDAKETEAPKAIDMSSQQAVAVLGIALIAMGEEVGSQMAFRMFGHLIRYGEPVIRRAVPLALGLISVSNPQLTILETLSKFSHDADADTSCNAIFALGLTGAGTNNARIVSMLRQLATYHSREPQQLMLVRIAQGMVHMGKGTMTLNPFHSDRQLMCSAAVAGLFATTFAFLDARNTVLNGKQHYLLFCLVPAMQPRLLITLVEDETSQQQGLKQVNVTARVGQAVDVVAQAGRPKSITGFQTHTTPVLLAFGERAELATEEYLPLTPYLEGLAILKKNPEWDESKDKKEVAKK